MTESLPRPDTAFHVAVAERIEGVTAALPAPIVVERVPSIDADAFRTRYAATSRPVVLTDELKQWPARAWTIDLLREGYGSVPVDFRSAGAEGVAYSVLPLADAIRALETADGACDAEAGRFARPYVGTALPDAMSAEVPTIRFYPDSPQPARLWFGPSGAGTGLHQDTFDNFIGQIIGRRRVTLVAPHEADRLAVSERRTRNLRWSPVDPLAPDLAAFPDFAAVDVVDVELARGEMLFVPAGWFHDVRTLDLSLSVSRFVVRVPEAAGGGPWPEPL